MLLCVLKLKELNNSLKKVFITSFILLLIDQITKILVVNYLPPEGYKVFGFDWFNIIYVLNNGMAFGYTFPFDNAKLFLTLFRILVVILGFFYIKRMIKSKMPITGLLISFGLILGGAIGNIIDSTFYGVIYQNKELFHGEVVDMLHFPFFTIDLPNWLSFLEGSDERFTFFAPVFNIADSGIFIGITMILIFYRNQFN